MRSCGLMVFLALAGNALAQQAGAQLAGIHVIRKRGSQTGPAVVSVRGKLRRVERDVYEAWPVNKGRNAVLIRRSVQRGTPKIVLQYMDGETRKRRDLGTVPFTSARLLEMSLENGRAVFLLSGQSGGRAYIVAANSDAVHGRLDGSLLTAAGQNLSYRIAEGREETVTLDALLASRLTAIYSSSETAASTLQCVQFLHDGNAVLLRTKQTVERGPWYSDGVSMHITPPNGPELELKQSSLTPIGGIPAGTRVSLRLEQALASNKLKPGDAVNAVLISPASVDGKIYLPGGTAFLGRAIDVHGVGWGLKHETAAMTLEFTSARTPDGDTVNLHSYFIEVENAQEKVDGSGKIRGIRSTGTLGYSAESKIVAVATADPVGYLFSNAAATAAFGFAEPEILYPAGTEVLIETSAPIPCSKTYPNPIPPVASTSAGQQQLSGFIRPLSFRTMTSGSNKPSDIANLLFIGPQDGLVRAFKAAGWASTDEVTAQSVFSTVRTLAGNETYRQAPMSTLLLDERPPVLTLSKTTNTFASRHHLRIFDPHKRFNGVSVYTSSATQDIGIGFSRSHKTFIHLIDQYIDNERSKVVNDLVFTGCVQAAQLVPRPWVPLDANNSTGDRLRTDGAIAVLQISDCAHPRSTAVENAVPPGRFERITRDTFLSIRNSVYRGNLVYQGASGGVQLHRYLASRNDFKRDPGAWRKSDLSGTEFSGKAEEAEERQPSTLKPQEEEAPAIDISNEKKSHRWDPPRYEIAVHGGYLRYPSTRTEALGVRLTPLPGHENLPAGSTLLADAIDGGWTVGLSITLNTWRWVSNEFAYHYERGKYEYASLTPTPDPSDGLVTEQSGLATRQFSYNVLVHARRPESRWRPYVAAGPVLQLLSLTDAVTERPGRVYRLGLQNVGIFKAAFDFGRTPPLEGGGIFQFGVQYGGGIKVRVHPRLLIRADFRETWTPTPHFLRDSYTTEYFDTENYRAEFLRFPSESKFRSQRITLGFAFTF